MGPQRQAFDLVKALAGRVQLTRRRGVEALDAPAAAVEWDVQEQPAAE